MSIYNVVRQCALRSAFFFLGGVVLLAVAGITNADSMADYQLGSGDKISITVYGEDDLSLETMLSNSGVINYPFLGQIKVSGLRISQLEKVLISGLKGDYLINPSVHVAIVEYRPFFIKGEVEKPGAYPFQPGLTVGKAAALAQGFTERASTSKIFIVRGGDSTQTKIKGNITSKLKPGDIVTVQQSFF
jgi:protein involved in polysaccharide export with SLBB domain